MKKILTVFLTLCLLVSLATCFAFSANAEETDIEVTVGQVFEWNDQSADTAKQVAWRKSGGTSPDGLWKYQFYSLNRKIYQDLVAAGNMFAWSKSPGNDDNGLGYARVGNYGKNFHPGYAADVVKVFTAPSGGSVQISTTINRVSDLQAGTEATGTSFAIYVEDRLVYPESGEYLTLSSTSPQTINVTVDVAKNERVRIHIGAIGEQTSDGVEMSNTITYKSINDSVANPSAGGTVSNSQYQASTEANFGGNGGGNRVLPNGNDDGGLSAGAIVGIVLGVVAVIGIAVAVVVIVKKKKQE